MADTRQGYRLCEGFHVHAIHQRVESTHDIEASLQKTIGSDGPSVVERRIESVFCAQILQSSDGCHDFLYGCRPVKFVGLIAV